MVYRAGLMEKATRRVSVSTNFRQPLVLRLVGGAYEIEEGADFDVLLRRVAGALLDVLEEAERPALAEIRGVLADDLAHRRGIP